MTPYYRRYYLEPDGRLVPEYHPGCRCAAAGGAPGTFCQRCGGAVPADGEKPVDWKEGLGLYRLPEGA